MQYNPNEKVYFFAEIIKLILEFIWKSENLEYTDLFLKKNSRKDRKQNYT